MKPLLLAALSLLSLAGCDPHTVPDRAYLTQISYAPPSKQAQLTTDSEGKSGTVTLSQGVAMAFSCSFKGDPCAAASANPVDGAVVGSFPALGASYGGRQPSVFVLTGSSPGTTRVDVEFSGGSVPITVTVVP